MSATINHEVFAEYFHGAPVLSIPGITHPVKDRQVLHCSDVFRTLTFTLIRYLEDVVSITGYSIGQLRQLADKKLDELRSYHGNDLSDETLTVIHNLTGSGSVDYQVILLRFQLLLQAILIVILVNCYAGCPHRRDTREGGHSDFSSRCQRDKTVHRVDQVSSKSRTS
jgi:hypothetical protein